MYEGTVYTGPTAVAVAPVVTSSRPYLAGLNLRAQFLVLSELCLYTLIEVFVPVFAHEDAVRNVIALDMFV